MRIVFLSPPLMKKEARSLTLVSLANELSRKGNEVIVCCPDRKEHQLNSDKINLLTYKKGVINFFFAPSKMLRNKKVDVINIFSSSPLWVIPAIILKLRRPEIKIIHSMKSYPIIKDSKLKKEGFFAREIKKRGFSLIRGISYITVPTKIHADFLVDKKVKKEKIKIVKSFIDHNKFYPKNKSELKQRYHLKSKKVILYYGAMWEAKGAHILIEAMKKILKSEKNVLFICIPRNGSYPLKYYKHLKQHGLSSQVKFIMQDVKIEDYVNLADLVVLPYPHLEGTEGNPSCMLEAMACKTAVVTTNLPELKEIAEGCVFMAKAGDVSSLAKTIKLAIDKPSPGMIERAYQKSKEFNVGRIAEEFDQLYQEIL